MKKITVILLFCIAFSGISAIMKEDGRAGATGSPGETTCNTSSCHVGNPLNSGGGSIIITAPTLTNWEYIPGTVYPISVTVSKPNVTLFGFGFEALRSTGANGGMFGITNPVETQIKLASIGGNLRTNVVHQLNGGASNNSHTFTFNWTAPASGTGAITFYSAGNAANNNGQASGDFIYTTSQVVTESTSGIGDSYTDDRLLKVFPNPAYDKFNIAFPLAEPAFVEIVLVDPSGKVITEFVSMPLPAGDHNFNYQADAAVTKGLYFVVVKINEQRVIKRIVIL